MQSIEDTEILKFNSNTLQEVRKELNLHHEGVLEQMITEFENWILKQNHFTKKKFDRRYLETSIIMAKGSLERAKSTLDKLCALKTLQPQFFSKYDAKNELLDSSGFMIEVPMPRLLPNNYRIYLSKLVSSDFNSAEMFNLYRLSVMVTEYIKCYDYALGFIWVLDCRDVNLIKFVSSINIMDLNNSMSVLVDGYSMRIKAIHLLSLSRGIDVAVNLLKQIVSKKVGNRIHVHQTIESLCEHVPKSSLPKEYGGDEKPLKEIHENWVNALSSEKNVELLKDLFTAGTDEKYRLQDNYHNDILGIPGSFKTLVVD